MKVVFDTNILVSALAFPGGTAEAALARVISGEVRLVISKATIHELLDVMARKFGGDVEELARVAVFLAEIGELARPRRKVAVLADDADNRILECALAGRADAIVTGDRGLLALGAYKTVKIMSLRRFLDTPT